MATEKEHNPRSDQFSDIVARLKEASNVLVTVKRDPDVDHLAACLGLTLALNKIGKHASAVFSGKVPSTIGFLEPEKTLETNTDSLRDFIISLDKSKADKLRYKVEDEVVKIFITPYKTSINETDLDFSQGDFNVDAVIAIGIHEREELDEAIVQHGRILHDATVMSINVQLGPEIGSINWTDEGSSSLSEMASDIAVQVKDDVLDEQIATAFLTGIVATTDRFRNEKANPHTMSVAGALMAAGASTQLVATKLEETPEPSDEIPEIDDTPNDDGTIDIQHDVAESLRDFEAKAEDQADDDIADILDKVNEAREHQQEVAEEQNDALDDILQEDANNNSGSEPPKDQQDDKEALLPPQSSEPESSNVPSKRHTPQGLVLEPPSLGGQLTANSLPEHQQYSPDAVDPLSAANPAPSVIRRPKNVKPDHDKQTLADLEMAVSSPHVQAEGSDPANHITPLPGQDQIVEPDLPVNPNPEPAPASQPDVVTEPEAPVAEIPPPPEPDHARDAVERAVNSSLDYKPEPLESVGSTPLGLNIQGAEFHDPDQENKSNQTPPPPVPPPLPPQ